MERAASLTHLINIREFVVHIPSDQDQCLPFIEEFRELYRGSDSEIHLWYGFSLTYRTIFFTVRGKKILPSLNMRCDASSSQAAVGGLGHSLVDLIYVLESSLKFLWMGSEKSSWKYYNYKRATGSLYSSILVVQCNAESIKYARC